jgi:hypothetical protein
VPGAVGVVWHRVIRSSEKHQSHTIPPKQGKKCHPPSRNMRCSLTDHGRFDGRSLDVDAVDTSLAGDIGIICNSVVNCMQFIK